VQPPLELRKKRPNSYGGHTGHQAYRCEIFDAEQAGYNVRFVTYLSRFLPLIKIVNGGGTPSEDFIRARPRPIVNALRLQQFWSLSASVEVGLQGYRADGVSAMLLRSLLRRYCPDIEH
jgi:hypothetical protein